MRHTGSRVKSDLIERLKTEKTKVVAFNHGRDDRGIVDVGKNVDLS
jgi:hypothetical protein